MKIVIDIPETFYKDCKECCELKWGGYYTSRLMNAIKNSTPLPEHHGRLIDADALEEYFRNVRKELKASDYKSGIEFFVRDEMLLNFQLFIHLCDAIIEGSENV